MKFNLRIKIVIVQSLSIFILLSISSFISYSFNKNRLESELTQCTRESVIRLSESLSEPLWYFNEENMASMIVEGMQDENIQTVLIYQNDNLLLGRYKTATDEISEFISWDEHGLDPEDYYLKDSMKIVMEDEPLGVLTAYVTDSGIRSRLLDEMVTVIVQSVILGIVLILITVIVLHFLVLNPLYTVSSGLKDISEGAGDLTKVLTVRSDDEIGQLSRFFNIFSGSLNHIITDLKISFNKTAETGDEIYSHVDHSVREVEEITGSIKSISEQFDHLNNRISDSTAAIRSGSIQS